MIEGYFFLFGFAFSFGFLVFAFGLDALEEEGGGLVGGVLGDEFASEGFGEDGLIQVGSAISH